MRPFAYERAEDAASAVALIDEHTRFLAGGTNLVDLMKLGVETPERLVDVSRLPFAEVEPLSDGGVRIGAGARLLQGLVTSWKYEQRVRWSRLPPTVATLRSWPDAPARTACASSG